MPQLIQIKQITLEGFKSYSMPTTFKFNNTGLHLIKGLNGGGKTSLFSALTWGLFKVNLNDTSNTKIPTWKWLRHKGYKGTRVQVLFGIGKYKYLIARHIDYKGETYGLTGGDSLLIFKKLKTDKEPFNNNDLVTEERDKNDMQGYINKLLGLDSRTFLNSILFGQRMDRLMDSKDAEKRELFEKLFDSSFIDDLKAKATLRSDEAKLQLNDFNRQLTILNTKGESLTEQLSNAENIITEFKARRKQRLAQLKGVYDATKEDYEELLGVIRLEEAKPVKAISNKLNKLSADVDTAREAYYDAKDAVAQIKRDINNRKGELGEYQDKENKLWEQLKAVKDKCPVCGSKLLPENIAATKAKIELQIKDGVASIRSMQSGLVNLAQNEVVKQKACDAANAVFTAANDACVTYKDDAPTSDTIRSKLKERRVELFAELTSLSNQYKAEKDRTPPTVNIETIQQALAEIETLKPDVEKKIRVRERYVARLNWWVTKCFNSGGLRSFIFSASLNKLNQHLSAYTQYFGYSIVFGIDLTKSLKPFYVKVTIDGEHDVDYEVLSGGQKCRVDICIAFALFDVVSATTSFNLIIFDEVSENLDVQAQELLDMILRIKAETKAIYVISHTPTIDISNAIEYNITGGKSGLSKIT